MHQQEQEVFRYSEKDFDTTKYYEYAYRTRQEGTWPNERYFTTQPLTYVGRFLRMESWGMGDGSGCAAYFDCNGQQIRVEFDYEGTICFREYTNNV